MNSMRNDWTKEEILEIYNSPLLELIYRAGSVHRSFHVPSEVQVCSLISIKTGGCPEDCKYCPQAARYQTGVQAEGLMNKSQVKEIAKNAVERGATRICMGAAWRHVRDSKQFDDVLDIVKDVSQMGVEVCCTLGMLNESQAKRLKEAGLYAYNHNLDSSKEFYKTIISTRTYEERLQTLDAVESAGISVCCGGIIGMGETVEDRVSFLHTLATRNKHPESVPINFLIPIPGTPLEDQKEISIWDAVRTVATARILMPSSMVRLSGGRLARSLEDHALCFLAGANSIHTGEKLLTTPLQGFDHDAEMFKLFGLKPRPAYQAEKEACLAEACS